MAVPVENCRKNILDRKTISPVQAAKCDPSFSESGWTRTTSLTYDRAPALSRLLWTRSRSGSLLRFNFLSESRRTRTTSLIFRIEHRPPPRIIFWSRSRFILHSSIPITNLSTQRRSRDRCGQKILPRQRASWLHFFFEAAVLVLFHSYCSFS